MQEDRYVFETEWFDAQADLIRKYLLTFYPTDGTIEMVSIYSNEVNLTIRQILIWSEK